ncbi:MAG: dihydroorotate dehydrogenase electron transfer subunit [Thermoleophilaceae bacterium]
MSERRTLAPFGRRAAPVEANERLGAYRLVSVRDEGGPAPRPGQFYMLATERGWGGDGERPYLPRAFSHARAREEGGLDFLLEAVGPGTARLAEARVGERLLLVGPLGIGFERTDRDALLVGGGIGAAPILALSDEIDGQVMLGFRSAEHAAAASLFGGEPALATDDGSAGRRALVTELLREALDAASAPTVYACGPPPMLEAVRALCAEREVPAQLALESGMACGYGACFGCVVPTRSGYVRLCVDGPVLDAADLESALVPGAGH